VPEAEDLCASTSVI